MIKLNYHWHIKWEEKSKNYYVKTTYGYHDENGKYKQTSIYLHSVILDTEPFQIVDHKNHNTLDNTKENLRPVTKDENNLHRKGANCTNKSTGVRNVHFNERNNEYWVQFSIKYKHQKWVFPADQFEEACKFAKEKRKELYGNIGA